MPDFYDNLNNLNQNTQNQTPSIAELEMQGHMLNAQLNDPFSDYEPLFDMYPRYKNQIQEAFNRGIPRRFVEKFLNEHVEPKLNFVGTPDQVNSFLGRDEASQQRLRDYNEAKRFQTFREAFPDKSDQEISDAFAVSQSNGVSPQALLQYPELMKKIVNGRKLHEGYIDSILRGSNNLGVTLYSGYIGMKYFLGAISKEEANKQWADSDKHLIEEPLNTDVLNRFLAGGANVTSQGFTTMAGGAAGAKIGAWLGGLIGGPPGAIAGGAIGSYVLPALEMFTLQAGNDMREFANKTDLNGQPINENAARFAAGVTGLITTATEMFTLKKAMAMFPGANKLFGWNKESVQHAISNPTVNQALSKIAEDFVSSLNWSTAHNVIESAGSMAGDVLSEYISGQPFPQKDLRFVENIIETILNSYRDFTASGLVNAIPRLMGLAVQQRKARNVQQGRIREFANFMGVSTEGARQALNMLNEYEYEKKKSESDSENKQQDVQPQEAQSDVQNEQTEQQDIQPDAVSEVQPETQPQDVQQEVQTEVVPEVQQENQQETNQKSIHDYDYIYLPISDLQKFIQDNPDFADIHGIDSDSETALTPEQFERISSANPEFISSIMNDIRFGSNGMTVHEAQLKLNSTDPEKAEFFHSEENQKLMQSVTQQLLDAGIEEQEANDLALLWGVMGTNLKVTEGISIKAPVINQQENPQIDYSRLSSEYDINNPDTWPDRERAEKFKEAVAWGKLPEAHSLVQNIFDYLRGNKPERADDLQPQSEEVFKGLKQEAPDKVKSTRNDLAKQELDDYKETLRQANLDTIHSLNLRDNPDPTRYEFNSQFPKGKSRNPTEQYYFENFDGKTRIDVATDGTDLKVRIKSEGNKDTAIFAIKNYRSAVLSQVLGDVLDGFSIDGIKLSETPAAMYLSQALRSFWDKFNLRKTNINTTSYTPNVDVQTQNYTPNVDVQTESLNPNLDVNTETYSPEVDSVTDHYTIPLSAERLERDFNLERTPAPDVHSTVVSPAEEIRKNIPTQITTDFDSVKSPKAEAYLIGKPNINVERVQPDIKLGVEHLPLELVPQSPHGPDYDRDNSVVFDEDNYSPDFEYNENALKDIPEERVPDSREHTQKTKTVNVAGNDYTIPIPVSYTTGQPIPWIDQKLDSYWNEEFKKLQEKDLSVEDFNKAVLEMRETALIEYRELKDVLVNLSNILRISSLSREGFIDSLQFPAHYKPSALMGDEILLRNAIRMILTDEDFAPQMQGRDEIKLALIHALEAPNRDELINRLAQMHPEESQKQNLQPQNMQDTQIAQSAQNNPEQNASDYEAVSPETKRENMPEAARFKLAQDEQAWHKTVDRILADDSITDEGATPVYAMKTPLVFSLVDAKHPAMELDIDQEKIKRILNKHHDMTPEQLKDLARALTDPTAIFESGTRKKSVEVLTDLKGEEGYEVLVAVNLNQQKGTINKIDSAYPKVDRRWGGSQPYRHYQDAATKGRLLYLNRQKAAEWAKISGVDLAPFAADAKTEADLISLWNKHKENGYYYTDKNGNPIAFTSWKYGRAVINFLQNTNIAADVHEFGHAAFFLMQALEKQGSVGMKQDIDIILNHAGVTREAFDADVHRAKGGAREIAQEYFAKAWEAYLAEGKAPNKKLQPVFTRIRKLLLDVYDDITNQLGIQLDNEVRGVFDRLLGMDEDSSASVADIVQNELRVENQIKAYEAQQRELLAQQNESFQNQHELETDPHLFDIDEQSAQYVDEWINQRDYQEILDDEFKSKKEMTDFLIAAVKDNGHINYQSIKELAGEKAHQIYNAWRRLFAKGGMHIDDMQSAILNNYGDSFPLFDTEHSTHALLDFLENNSPLKNSDAPSMIAPKFAVNTNFVNAFLAAGGVDETVDYLKTRKDFLERRKNQTEEIKAEINEINDWLKRLDGSVQFDEELRNPHKRPKRNISQRDLRRSINTAFKMGEQSERVIQETKSQIQMDKMQSRFDEQLQATEAKYQDKLQAQKDKAQQREETLTEKFKSQIQNLKEKDRARLEAKLQQLQQAREQDKAKHKERLERITQALQDRADNKLQKKQQQFQRKIDSLQERINNLRNARDAKQQKSRIKRLVRSIVRMGKSKSISVNMQQEIRNLLNEYNLDRKDIEHRDKIREFLDVKELPLLNDENSMNNELAEANLTQQDVDDFLSKIHIEDMSLSDVQVLHQAVSDLFTQGREEYQNWKQERDNRRADYHDRLVQPLLELKSPEKTVVTGKDDLNKKFKLPKVGDMGNQFWDSIQTPGRFLASLGESFRRLFDDGITSRRDKLYTWVDQRKQAMLQNIKQLGLSLWDFAKPAITIDGKTYSWEECHSIWLAFKNENSKLAVLWGNFINNQNGIPKLYDTQDEAMSAINQIFELMHQHPEHIKTAELIIQEFEQNFDRLHEAGAKQFNTDIQHEENYTPIHRLRYQSPQGLIDAETEQLAQSGTNAQIMQKVENGFTRSRVDINPIFQQPVDLHAWSNWLDAVTEQEYYIHLAGYASDLQSALLMRDENGNSVVDLIKSRRGLNDWDTLKSIYNDSITDKDVSESEAARSIASYLLRARSFAYIPFRPVTAVIQSASYLTAFPYTSHGHLFRTLAKFTEMCAQGKYNEFMENVFQKAGELRFASGDFADENYRRELMMSKSLPAGAKAIIDKYGYAGVRFVDRTTKALVFHAAYESNIENGMSEEDAVRLANRAVRDTQPASTTREATRLNRKNGWQRFILTQFMAPLAPVFNMAIVDVARALAHPSWNNVKAAACFAISAGMTIFFSQFLRDLAGRRLPNGEEDDYGNVDTWGDWILNGLAEGVLGSLPVFNNSFLALYRMINGRHFQNENRLDAPFVALGKAANYFFNDDYEGQYNDKAVNELVKALALFGLPLPYAAFRDIYRLFKGNEE